jgi:hypothetical protein
MIHRASCNPQDHRVIHRPFVSIVQIATWRGESGEKPVFLAPGKAFAPSFAVAPGSHPGWGYPINPWPSCKTQCFRRCTLQGACVAATSENYKLLFYKVKKVFEKLARSLHSSW